MAIGIRGGHQVKGAFGGKGRIDLLPGKFSAIGCTAEFIIGGHAGRDNIRSIRSRGDALVPQARDSGGAVRMAE